MNFRVILVLAAAGASCAAALGETLTFTPTVPDGIVYRWSNPSNWLTDGNENKKPAAGDDLVIGVSLSGYRHAADCYGIYLRSIRFKYGADYYGGISHNGFYLSEGGEGLVMEGGINAKTLWAGIAMDGTVSLCISNNLTMSGATLGGRSSSAKGRFVKLGPSTLTIPALGDNMTGGTIREGTFQLNADSGKSGLDFHFDGYAASAWFTLGGNIDLRDGALTSSDDLPTTDHGVTSSSVRMLTISGTPKTNEMYFTGGFHGKASFRFAPTAAGCSFTLARSVSTTTGSIAVSNAVLRLADGASFTALSELRAENGGVLEIENGVSLPTDVIPVICDGGVLRPTETCTQARIRLLDGGRIDVPSGVSFTVLSLSTNGAAVAAGEYTATNCSWVQGGSVNVGMDSLYSNPIYLDVPSGTKSLSEAIATYNETHAGEDGFTAISVDSMNGGADKARTLVKTGQGVLAMASAIRGFEGAVHIAEGVLETQVPYSIGRESNDVAHVYVYPGATFASLTTEVAMNAGRTVHIAGEGGSGRYGALYCPDSAVLGRHNVFGSHLILEADATINVGAWVYASENDATLNGYKLTIRSTSRKISPVYLKTIIGNGQIEVRNGQWSNYDTHTFTGTDAGNVVTFADGGGYRMRSSSAPFAGDGWTAWTYHFKGPDCMFFTDYDMYPRDRGLNRLKMRTILDTMLDLSYQVDRRRGHLQVATPISGSGGFKTSDNRTVFLHMFDQGCTFTGGFDFTRGTIWAYGNGTIPNGPDAGAVTLHPTEAPYFNTESSKSEERFANTFDGIAFMCPDAYELPELVASGTFPARVQSGEGTWRKVTVAGTGGVDYFSGIGAPLLDVQNGCVKLPRGAAPGLWEGTNVYSSAAAAQTAWAAADTSTNLVVRGPSSALQRLEHNYTTWRSNERMTYTGYIWNRSGANVTWTLASSLNGPVKVLIDGVAVLSAAASELKAANVTLTPGPHAFEYRACNGSGPYAPSGWCDNFGFVYDTQGRNDTSTTNNFEMCVDTGDGALFTRYADPEGHLPAFDVMKFAKGTRLDVNGNAYVAATVTGWPVVTNTAADASAASFSITNAFVVDGATLAADATMKVAMPLSFGTTGGVSVTNLENAVHGAYTLATAAEPIVFEGGEPLRNRLRTDTRGWVVHRSPDGKSLTLDYCANTILVFR